MISVLCVANLHEFSAAPGERTICPECGCRFVRRAGRHGSLPDIPDANLDAPRLDVKTLEGRHKVAGDRDTWLGDKAKFVRLVMDREPATSEAEMARNVRAWFGTEE